MKFPLRILHLEDDANDAELVQTTLEAEGVNCVITRVQTRDDFISALERGGIDLILSDVGLPAFDGLSATEIVRARWPSLPLIIVSGSLGEELVVDLFKNGVKDCISKGHLSRLAASVRRVMQDVEG
jgi:DNA-binding response OmpR family regulator